MNAVAVASRAQLCVNPEVRAAAGASAARLNERCLELGKPKAKGERARKGGKGGVGVDGADGADKSRPAAGSGCPYLKKRHAAVADLAEAALAAPMDIEDLAAAGTRHRACAYYAARKALPRADLVFAPYASLLHKETRESLGINLRGSVLVFDEAHNLVEAVHGAHGSVLTGKQCEAVHAMVTAYVDRFYTRLAVGNLRHLKTLGALARGFAAALGGDKGGADRSSSNARGDRRGEEPERLFVPVRRRQRQLLRVATVPAGEQDRAQDRRVRRARGAFRFVGRGGSVELGGRRGSRRRRRVRQNVRQSNVGQ